MNKKTRNINAEYFEATQSFKLLTSHKQGIFQNLYYDKNVYRLFYYNIVKQHARMAITKYLCLILVWIGLTLQGPARKAQSA